MTADKSSRKSEKVHRSGGVERVAEKEVQGYNGDQVGD